MVTARYSKHDKRQRVLSQARYAWLRQPHQYSDEAIANAPQRAQQNASRNAAAHAALVAPRPGDFLR